MTSDSEPCRLRPCAHTLSAALLKDKNNILRALYGLASKELDLHMVSEINVAG